MVAAMLRGDDNNQDHVSAITTPTSNPQGSQMANANAKASAAGYKINWSSFPCKNRARFQPLMFEHLYIWMPYLISASSVHDE